MPVIDKLIFGPPPSGPIARLLERASRLLALVGLGPGRVKVDDEEVWFNRT